MKAIHKWLVGVGGAGAFIWLLGSASRPGKGRIVAPDVDYVPSRREWLWLARSIYCESSTHRGRVAAAWAMIQRFAGFRQRGQDYGASLTATVRSFSQPINPIWSSRNACRDGRGCCGHRCTTQDILRRRACQSRSWSQLPADVQEIAGRFLNGRPVPNPVPGLTDFAACWHVMDRGLTVQRQIGGNCFVVGPGVRGTVRVIPA